MLAGVTDCRRGRKWGCRGRLALGFKPRHSSHREGGPCGFGGEGRGSRSFGRVNRRGPCGFGREERGPCGFGVLLFATRLRQQERLPERKGEKGLLLVGREKVPHGSGLTGDCGSHTADGAGSLNHGLLLLFLRYGTPGWAEGEGRTVHLWVF